MGPSKRKLVFQPFIFRCYVSFREGNKALVEPGNPAIMNYMFTHRLDPLLLLGFRYHSIVQGFPMVPGEVQAWYIWTSMGVIEMRA